MGEPGRRFAKVIPTLADTPDKRTGHEATTLKIDNQNPLIRPGQTQQRDDARKAQGADQPTAKDADPAAMTHLSQRASDPSQDIDTARVGEIREAIREGRLEIRAERIADGLIANVREMLGKDGA